ncbi:MAG: hypothetical protein O3C43_23140 [Verrucomicrobia bacterium]|nr:hypothetical protein [Verrucomicrobiota bacterium]MDA1069381.1 hypothetical protein [Verrucomicrobiota bacterium]
MNQEANKKDVQEFQRVIDQGRFYEVLEWIAAGKPLRFVRGRYKKWDNGLNMAIQDGGHSIVKVLLERCDWTVEELSIALYHASSDRRGYLVELLFEHNAPVDECCFDDFCQMMDPVLMDEAIKRGIDPTKSDAFASALISTGAARPLLSYYKRNKDRIKGLDEQLSIALCKTVAEEKVRSSVLLLWAGADPYRKCPSDVRYDFPGHQSPEAAEYLSDMVYDRPILHELGFQANLEFYKKLKLDPPPEVLPELLQGVSFTGNYEFFKPLIQRCPVELLNDSERSSSHTLEWLISHEFERYRSWEGPKEGYLNLIRCFLEQGARWDPGSGNLRHPRNGLLSGGADYFVAVVRLLLKHEQDPTQIRKLVDYGAAKQVALSHSPDLISEVKEAERRRKGDANASDLSDSGSRVRRRRSPRRRYTKPRR